MKDNNEKTFDVLAHFFYKKCTYSRYTVPVFFYYWQNIMYFLPCSQVTFLLQKSNKDKKKDEKEKKVITHSLTLSSSTTTPLLLVV